MSILQLVGISDAFAEATTQTAQQSGGLLSMLPMLLLFVAVFYFLLVRPQQRRAKEQKQLMTALAVGDEVVTIGGIVGRLEKLGEEFILLKAVSQEGSITMKKSAIASVLPKGTIESI